MNTINRRSFLVTGAALFAAGAAQAKPAAGRAAKKSPVVLPPTEEGPLKVLFLGTGAADWLDKDRPAAPAEQPAPAAAEAASAAEAPAAEAASAEAAPAEAPAAEAAPAETAAPAEGAAAAPAAPEWRRHASVLLDGKVMIDCTASALDMIPEGVKVEDIVITHSHSDHFDADAIVGMGTVQRVYVDRGWATEARKAFIKAGQGYSGVDVVPVDVGVPFAAGGLHFLPLPANHDTGREGEQTLIYVVEKDKTRLLYATDTGGIMAVARRLMGKVTAIVMEATVGMGAKDNWRMFSHSTPELVAETANCLKILEQYAPPEGRKVYTTHLSRELNGSQSELEAKYPAGLAPARDGLEVEF